MVFLAHNGSPFLHGQKEEGDFRGAELVLTGQRKARTVLPGGGNDGSHIKVCPPHGVGCSYSFLSSSRPTDNYWSNAHTYLPKTNTNFLAIAQSKFILQKKKIVLSATYTEWQPLAREYLSSLPPATFPHSLKTASVLGPRLGPIIKLYASS